MSRAGEVIGEIFGGLAVILLIVLIGYALHGIGTYAGKKEVHEEAVKLGLGEWVIQEPTGPDTSRIIVFQWIIKELPQTINPSTVETMNVRR